LRLKVLIADAQTLESTAAESIQDLVHFAAPPVNEVVLSVQFGGQVIDEPRTLSEFWERIKAEFPGLQTQPPLPPVHEDFGPPTPGGPSIEILSNQLTSRYWFLSADEALLIQVQADRFSLNWRQRGAQEYPHYRTLRPTFEKHFRTFLECWMPGAAETVRPTWCEVTYINHVEAEGTTPHSHGALSRILRTLNPDPTAEALPPVEDTQLQQRFRIGSQQDPSGRLYLIAVPAFRVSDSRPIYAITLTARGKPNPASTDGILPFFDRGREIIVRGFTEATTPEMHELWERQP
jgi:uncharacterized protein (TIGR04255 family)